jgi:DNA processing protein
MTITPEQIAASPDLFARLRLILSDGIGPVSFLQLIKKHGSATEVIAMLKAAARKGTARTKLASRETTEADLERAQLLQARYLFLGHEGYPAALAELNDAPPILRMRGNPVVLTKTLIGVVGARNASAGGTKLTNKICLGLAGHGFAIVSGLARGIDTAAHTASVAAGTVACMAGGVDIIYPPENAALYEQIMETGLLLSEMPFGTKPQARHFPRRNRIISGLSRGLIVIEAARKSGSLITARCAAEQSRDVFAVPGSPLDPRALGCNQLIRDGAILVQNADDIISEYETMPLLRSIKPNQPAPTPTHSAPIIAPVTKATPKRPALNGSGLLSLLNPDPIHIDELVRLSGLSAQAILTEFTELELLGELTRHPGGKYSRISRKNE